MVQFKLSLFQRLGLRPRRLCPFVNYNLLICPHASAFSQLVSFKYVYFYASAFCVLPDVLKINVQLSLGLQCICPYFNFFKLFFILETWILALVIHLTNSEIMFYLSALGVGHPSQKFIIAIYPSAFGLGLFTTHLH